MKILILCAFENELKHFIHSLPQPEKALVAQRRYIQSELNGHTVFVSSMGIGTTNAANTSTIFCETLRPDYILVCGSAGGLRAGQMTGDLVISERIIDVDLFNLRDMLMGTPYETCLTDPHTQLPLPREFTPDAEFLAFCAASKLPNVTTGVIATSNAFPAPLEALALIRQLNCAGIEMESSAVFSAASYYAVPVMTIRAISNSLDELGRDLGTTDDAIGICSQRLSAYLHELLEKLSS